MQEEDASVLQLGADYQQSHCLFNTEVYLLLSQIQEDRQATYTADPLPPAFLATLKHTSTFSRFHDKDMAQYVRRLLASAPQLAEFELTQLANLCPETSEEAKTLIPSLATKLDDDTLQNLLDQISNARKMQG